MNQEKFENYGRALIISIGTFIVIYFMFIIVAKTYSTFQDNELRQLKKENMLIEKDIRNKEYEMIEIEIEQLKNES